MLGAWDFRFDPIVGSHVASTAGHARFLRRGFWDATIIEYGGWSEAGLSEPLLVARGLVICPGPLALRRHAQADSVGLVLKLIALVLPLGLDTFAVAAALGMTGLPARERVRVSLLFTAFEGAMPLLGFALGAPLGRAIGSSADYFAVAVLIGFGLYTLLGHESDETLGLADVLDRGPVAALALGLSISIDELAIGFTLGLLRVSVVVVVIVIAVQAFVLAQLGLRLGARLSERARETAERLAGLALTALGLTLLTEKLLT